MEAEPEVACVIPTYQSVAFAERCLRSVLAQAGVRVEVIVSDDSRDPDVREFVERLAQDFPQVRYFPGARTGNPAENWNAGLDRVAAPYALLIHHDEYLVDEGYLRRAVDALRQGRGKAIAAGHALAGEGGWSWFAVVSAVARTLRLPSWTLYLVQWIGPTAAFVFPARPDLRFDPRLVWIVDCDFYARVFRRHGELLRDERVCVVSTRHPGQITARVDPRVLGLEELRILARSERDRLGAWRWRLVVAFAELRLFASRLRRPRPTVTGPS